MSRRYLFADEAGDFEFRVGNNISRYFIVCTMTLDDCVIGNDLLELRRQLAWEGLPVGSYFHASEDKQVVRDRVFKQILDGHYAFRIQATIMEKRKALPKIRPTAERFFQYGWYYHFKHGVVGRLPEGDELLITTASIGTKKGQAVYTGAVNDVVGQHLPKQRWKTHFPKSEADPCLQAVDYCTWAIQRKWERGQTAAYDRVAPYIEYEFDLWSHGKTYHY
ncbi:hypothetical protein EN844_24705 [Mesorhizobium sp. M3A.F.Ca.ET.201.01.1.1]|uniref:DUF3800 domain-containing protein n=1 Tax=Mesorhizobium sp. M3A.F.Ca.ET.201.01.1.1 TaxID=2563946 RepID=UPI0010940349|nr:DUF3800 domain-containing protein [Mesorhizobium sp. M3A.F.Ca.ET.201.01.1.1]TGS63033.1 hypothetical protein EN844_24705 [Mesorhizobium sp. M3A.F.Ca.ET.201.01.1.1]